MSTTFVTIADDRLESTVTLEVYTNFKPHGKIITLYMSDNEYDFSSLKLRLSESTFKELITGLLTAGYSLGWKPEGEG